MRIACMFVIVLCAAALLAAPAPLKKAEVRYAKDVPVLIKGLAVPLKADTASVEKFVTIQWSVYSVDCPTFGGSVPRFTKPEAASRYRAVASTVTSPPTFVSKFTAAEVFAALR